MNPLQVYRGLVSTSPRLQAILGMLPYRPVPAWLGDFEFKLYGTAYGRDHGKAPDEIEVEAQKLAALVPGQQWTTTFIQRYHPGSGVKPHRDPRNNLGFTVIGLYGDFTPTWFTVRQPDGSDLTLEQAPGDVLVLPCTIEGVQGPLHSMGWSTTVNPLKGPRYAIILNTIT